MIIQANPDENDAALKYPNMELAQKIHKLTILSAEERLPLETEVFTTIATELKNPSLYRLVRDKLYGNGMVSTAVQLSEADLDKLATEAAARRTELVEARTTATESAGDTEVLDAQVAIAQCAAQSLDAAAAIAEYQHLLGLPKVSTSKQMDAWMAMARIHSFYGNGAETDAALAALSDLMAAGSSDWDRRNRAAVYQALQQLLHRDFGAAAKPLLAGVATFNCTELCSYQDFIVYGILTNLLHLPRQQLKSKILDGPEILSLAKDIPVVMRLVRSFYGCNYQDYLHALVDLEPILRHDRFLEPHADYWLRQLHVLAYKQYLDSYVTVQVSAMAKAFGVSEPFIDHQCSSMIAAGSLSAKIDKFGGVIVTARPDAANAKYRDMIQKGDLLLNRIQKLARVVDM